MMLMDGLIGICDYEKYLRQQIRDFRNEILKREKDIINRDDLDALDQLDRGILMAYMDALDKYKRPKYTVQKQFDYLWETVCETEFILIAQLVAKECWCGKRGWEIRILDESGVIETEEDDRNPWA
jgi:hypothetical protein